MLSEHSVSLMRPHIEKTLVFSKATRDIVTGFIDIAVVDFWEFGVIVDQ